MKRPSKYFKFDGIKIGISLLVFLPFILAAFIFKVITLGSFQVDPFMNDLGKDIDKFMEKWSNGFGKDV